MLEIWLTSDTHFDHANIIKYEGRPFRDNLDMTEVLISNWNSVVGPEDLIIHLGDVFFCGAERMAHISSRLNGRKILIRGNHDRGYTNTKFKKMGFDVFNYYFKDGFLLSHWPQDDQALNVAVSGGYLRGNIHGHVHGDISGLDQSIYRCVSVELTDYKPIKFSEVTESFNR